MSHPRAPPEARGQAEVGQEWIWRPHLSTPSHPPMTQDHPATPRFYITPRCAHPHYKLRFGARPVQFEKRRYRCSNEECKKARVRASTKGCGDRKQAVEKHIMREHPDKTYNTFVCVKCGKKKESPLQILEHLSTRPDKGGHGIIGTEEKLECLRAEYRGTHFR